MSVDLSGEITAIATAVLAVFAFATAILAGFAFWKQSREVRAIEGQVKDQEELTQQQATLLEIQGRQLELQQKQFDQQADERRRAQASRVFIWSESGYDPSPYHDGDPPPEPGIITHVRNTSEQPIYALNIDWGPEKPRWMESTHFPVLMPGDQKDPFQPIEHRNIFKLAPIARFRDAAGLHWILTPEGQLDESSAGKNDSSPDIASDVE
jgi:hypothetical protein